MVILCNMLRKHNFYDKIKQKIMKLSYKCKLCDIMWIFTGI